MSRSYCLWIRFHVNPTCLQLKGIALWCLIWMGTRHKSGVDIKLSWVLAHLASWEQFSHAWRLCVLVQNVFGFTCTCRKFNCLSLQHGGMKSTFWWTSHSVWWIKVLLNINKYFKSQNYNLLFSNLLRRGIHDVDYQLSIVVMWIVFFLANYPFNDEAREGVAFSTSLFVMANLMKL